MQDNNLKDSVKRKAARTAIETLNITEEEKDKRLKALAITPDAELPEPVEDPKNRNFLKHIKSFNTLLTMEAKEVPCIIKGMIVAKAINVISARTAEGKSVFMMRMLKDIAIGSKFLNTYPTKKQRILLIDMEMNENFLIDRVKTILQDERPGDIFYGSDLNIEKDYDNLKDLINGEGQYSDNGKYDMVVFDTLSLIHTRDENSNSEMTNVLRTMMNLINDTECTILFLHHHGKNSELSGAHKSRGATVIIDKASSHLTIRKTEGIIEDYGDQRKFTMVVEQAKPRLKDGFKRFSVEVDVNEDNSNFKLVESETETTEKIYAAQMVGMMDDGLPYSKKELVNTINSQLGLKISLEDSTIARTLSKLANTELSCMTAADFKRTFGLEPEYDGKKVYPTSKVYWLRGSIAPTPSLTP